MELPYKEHNFRFIIALPNEVDGLDGLMEKVAERGLLEDVFKMYPAGAEVILDMPKFEIKSKLDLNELLPKVKLPVTLEALNLPSITASKCSFEVFFETIFDTKKTVHVRVALYKKSLNDCVW